MIGGPTEPFPQPEASMISASLAPMQPQPSRIAPHVAEGL
jgi:hypothetical protein